MSDPSETTDLATLEQRAISRPLVTHIYTADPSAHVFEGKLYVYPSHDIDAGIPFDDDGSHWIGMAVREGVANAIKHGNKLDVAKKVFATFDLEDGNLAIRISDQGQGFDPAQVGDPLNPQNLMKTSGRGIFYMKTFMDRVDFAFVPGGGTELIMMKKLNPEEVTKD